MTGAAIPDTIAIRSDKLSATINPRGAELWTLRDAAGRDLLWDGDPAFWTGRAPLLFPVIGMLNGDAYRLDGRTYPMKKHGFARKKPFALVAQGEATATFALAPDEDIRARYPFDFRLEVRFAVVDATLSIAARVENRGAGAMPASFGFHPALRWPLPDGGARADTQIVFAHDEPEPIRRLSPYGGIAPADVPTPIEGRVLRLRDELFENDAIVMPHPNSHTVRLGAPGERGLEVSFPDMPELGIWTKPGAGYICIEPWQGSADPEGFAGDIRDKPGIVEIAPDEARVFAMSIRLFEAGE